jgi:predicted metal-dependent peptidase
MTAENKMTEIKTALLLHQPFFASLLLDIMNVKVGKFPEIFGPRTPTAATDGRNIWWDEDFLATLDLKEAVFVTCHEVGHAMFLHMPRGKVYQDNGFEGEPFDPQTWNVAGDYIINDMLVKSNIGTMPKVGLHDPSKWTHDMLVDDVYRKLKEHQKKNPQQGGNGKGGAGGNGQDTIDTHVNEMSQQITQAEMARAITTAAEAAKAMGKLPGALERFVTQILEPQVSWREKLRTFVNRNAQRESTTWRSPHRRRLVLQKVYLPSPTGFSAGHIVVAFDTSGSIGQNEINVFLSELTDILSVCRPEATTCMSCDAAVHTVEELEEGQDIINHPPKMIGGGGTSFIPVFEKIAELGIEPCALVYFTDMYGSFPSEPPNYPVIWCSTSEGIEGPFGETIHVDPKVKA